MEKLSWEKRPNGDHIGTGPEGIAMYVVPFSKSRHYHLRWIEPDEQLTDQTGSIAACKAAAEAHYAECVAAAERVAEEITAPVTEDEFVPGVEDATNPVVDPKVVDESLAMPEAIAELIETDVLAETLVDSEVVDSEVVNEALVAVGQQIAESLATVLPSVEQIEEAHAAVEQIINPDEPQPEPPVTTYDLTWDPIPTTQDNDQSSWIVWTANDGTYRVYRSKDRFGDDHYFGAGYKKQSANGGCWDAVEHGKSGYRKYKSLRDALDAVAHRFREDSGEADATENGHEVISYAGKNGYLDMPISNKPAKKLSGQRAKSDNKPKTETTNSEEEETAVKINEKDARSMCIAIGWKNAGDAKLWPMTKLIKKINKDLAENLDEVQEPDAGSAELKTFGRVSEALRAGQEIVIKDAALDDSDDGEEEDAGEKKAKRSAKKGGKKSGEAKPMNGKPKKEKTPSTNGHAKGTRYELFGTSVTAVIRWMGKNGWEFVDARKALNSLGAECADATVKIQLLAGRNGQRGEPATLTGVQQKELKSAAK